MLGGQGNDKSKVEEMVRSIFSNSDIALNHSTNLMNTSLDSLSVVMLSYSRYVFILKLIFHQQ